MTNTRRTLQLASFLLAAILLAILGGAALAQEDEQWTGLIWANENLAGQPVATRYDNIIDEPWGHGSPSPGNAPSDEFSVRWTRRAQFDPGYYRFTATMDDGMRAYLDGQLIIDEWADGPKRIATRDLWVDGGLHNMVVEFYDSTGEAYAGFTYEPAEGGPFYPNWKGEYFNNTSVAGAPVLVRDDRYLNQNWGTGSPAPGVVNSDNWSARWTRTLDAIPGPYTVQVTSDDGVRVWLNGQVVVDNWQQQAATTETFNYYWNGGPLPVRIDYFDGSGGARLNFEITSQPGSDGSIQPPVGIIPPRPIVPPTPAPPVCRAPSVREGVATQSAPMRVGPGEQYASVMQLSRCDVVILSGFTDPSRNWVRVSAGNVSGWVWADRLNLGTPTSQMQVWSTPPAPACPYGPSGQQGVAIRETAARSGPGTAYGEFTTISMCDVVVTDNLTDPSRQWVHIVLPGNLGAWAWAADFWLGVPTTQMQVIN